MSSSPFTQAVVAAVQNLYPKQLADSSFDNTGLLLEAPQRKGHNNNSVLLCVDLTKGVADEAIRRKDSVVIAYHPIIFRGLKSLTLGNSQQQSLLRLAQEGISVYSPHTAVDAAPGGLNDFLADIVTDTAPSTSDLPNASQPPLPHTREVITPCTNPPAGFEGAGYGRIVRFSEPQTLRGLVRKITKGLGPLAGVSVATPQYIPRHDLEIPIRSIGICAGSGGSMLSDLEVDLLFTGELGHHEALAAVEGDRSVVTAFHSNTERMFLEARMRAELEAEVRRVWESRDNRENTKGDEALVDFKVVASEVDRDPYTIMHPQMAGW